jgi:hypothetical protein
MKPSWRAIVIYYNKLPNFRAIPLTGHVQANAFTLSEGTYPGIPLRITNLTE